MSKFTLVSGDADRFPTDEEIRENIFDRVIQYGDEISQVVARHYGLKISRENPDDGRRSLSLNSYLGGSTRKVFNTPLPFGLIHRIGSQCPALSEAIQTPANLLSMKMREEIPGDDLDILLRMPSVQIATSTSRHDPLFASLYGKNADLFLHENVAFCRAVYLLALKGKDSPEKVLYDLQQNFVRSLYITLVEVFGQDDPLLKRLYIAMDSHQKAEIKQFFNDVDARQASMESSKLDKKCVERERTTIAKRAAELELLEGLDRSRASRRHGEEDASLIELSRDLEREVEDRPHEHKLYRCLNSLSVPFAFIMTEVIHSKSLDIFLQRNQRKKS